MKMSWDEERQRGTTARSNYEHLYDSQQDAYVLGQLCIFFFRYMEVSLKLLNCP